MQMRSWLGVLVVNLAFPLFLAILILLWQPQSYKQLEPVVGICFFDNQTQQWIAHLKTNRVLNCVGLGTASHLKQEVIEFAISSGKYKLLDSAQASEWYNESAVGNAVERMSLHDKSFDRRQIAITTKIHPKYVGNFSQTIESFEKSLRNLKTDYVDVLLLHYPRCWSSLCGFDSVTFPLQLTIS